MLKNLKVATPLLTSVISLHALAFGGESGNKSASPDNNDTKTIAIGLGIVGGATALFGAYLFFEKRKSDKTQPPTEGKTSIKVTTEQETEQQLLKRGRGLCEEPIARASIYSQKLNRECRILLEVERDETSGLNLLPYLKNAATRSALENISAQGLNVNLQIREALRAQSGDIPEVSKTLDEAYTNVREAAANLLRDNAELQKDMALLVDFHNDLKMARQLPLEIQLNDDPGKRIFQASVELLVSMGRFQVKNPLVLIDFDTMFIENLGD